ncbi:MAG: energy-coupling factor ABC transporter ATP-binding protein [Firmicutes bacterium]|nr:energy-coupling factor ABC transporter ATP-binding protein [Bacillota bacterium]
MSHHLVEAKDLTYIYPDGTKALQEITFRITHGEAVGIVGANGAGKSTLLMHITGILLPVSGTVRVGDYPLTPRTIPQIRRNVGFIFQNPDDQLFMPTVFDDVAFGPLNQGLPIEEAGQRAIEALQTVGAVHLKDRPPYKLSGGEKRAVAIATVLAMSPDILVMDEPTAGLDPVARRNLIHLLAGFKHTKIIASHDLDLILDLCERTIVLNEGRVIADGSAMEIFNDDKILTQGHLEKPLALQGCPVCSRQ